MKYKVNLSHATASIEQTREFHFNKPILQSFLYKYKISAWLHHFESLHVHVSIRTKTEFPR